MNSLRLICFALALLAGLRDAPAQGFYNLNFDTATITTIHNPGGNSYTASVLGWGCYTDNSVNNPAPMSVPYDTIALDAPAVTLQGTDSLGFPALQGSYSVLLQGGTRGGGLTVGNTNGASIFQTGQIPATSLSLNYLGDATVQVAFNGQTLPSIAIGNTASSTVWGVDVSAYAGQSGEMRFTVPWQRIGMLDDIQFSRVAVPEPSTWSICAVCVSLLFWSKSRRNQVAQRSVHSAATQKTK